MRPKNEERKMQVYDFISAGIEQNGVCPTTDEIANGLGMAKSTVSKYFNRLADEGLIERRGRYRTVTAEGGGYSRMPILGTVACGEPILAIEEVQGYLPIDKQTLGHGEYFGLVAQGDSMIGVGVCDGETVFDNEGIFFVIGNIFPRVAHAQGQQSLAAKGIAFEVANLGCGILMHFLLYNTNAIFIPRAIDFIIVRILRHPKLTALKAAGRRFYTLVVCYKG